MSTPLSPLDSPSAPGESNTGGRISGLGLSIIGVLVVVVIGLVIALLVLVTGRDGVEVATESSSAAQPTTDVEPSATEPTSADTDASAVDIVTLRGEAAEAAGKFMVAVNTYGPDDLSDEDTMPGYADRLRDLLTDRFVRAFDQGLSAAEQSVAEAGVERTAQLWGSGVAELTENDAEVLVTGAFVVSYPDADSGSRSEVEPSPFRVSVSLVREDGAWLVDDFVPVVDAADAGIDPSPDTLIEEYAAAAQAAAVTAAPQVLSYDYRSLDEDQARGLAVVTQSYGSDYAKVFAALRTNAVKERSVVTTTVLASGVVTATPTRVELLLLLNRPTTSRSTDGKTTVYRDQATVTMQWVDGTWLIDDLQTDG